MGWFPQWDDMRRVLLISYAFPPVGGAGVQRITKFAKYLHEYGWTPSVLTVANPSVPAWDPTLLSDVPTHVSVRRARTWEPGYAAKAAMSPGAGAGTTQRTGLRQLARGMIHRLAKLVLQPDPQILWMPEALREGRRLLREVPHAAIVASGPPFSAFLIGAALSRSSGLPLVLDYRDEWDLTSAYGENRQFDAFSLYLQKRLQRQVIRRAKVLLATTRSSCIALEKLRDSAGSDARVVCIYNGYDPADFPATVALQPPNGTFRLVYTGTLWNLTSVAPLVSAVQKLSREAPALAARLEMVIAGRRTEPQQRILAGLAGLPCRLVEHPYLDHDRSVELLAGADGLCILLSDVPGAGRVVPAKLFECMAAKRPIWAIAPEGELWDLLREHPAVHLYEPKDTDGLAEALRREIEGSHGHDGEGLVRWDASDFSRCNQSRQLAGILDELR